MEQKCNPGTPHSGRFMLHQDLADVVACRTNAWQMRCRIEIFGDRFLKNEKARV